jgi:hypothetical protein
VTPRLPEQPLNLLTLVLLRAGAQTALVVLNSLCPRYVPSAWRTGDRPRQNPVFWLRLGVGWSSAGAGLHGLAIEHHPLDDVCHGLLYIAMGGVSARCWRGDCCSQRRSP